MNITINPKLENLLTTTASGQGLTPEQFITHHIEKHLISTLRNQTADKLKELSIDEVTDVKTSVEAVLQAKRVSVTEEVLITPTEETPV